MTAHQDHEEIRVTLARIEERVCAMHKNWGHAMEHINDKLDDLASKDSLMAIERRTTKLEANQTWVVRSVLGTVISVLAGVLSFISFHR